MSVYNFNRALEKELFNYFFVSRDKLSETTQKRLVYHYGSYSSLTILDVPPEKWGYGWDFLRHDDTSFCFLKQKNVSTGIPKYSKVCLRISPKDSVYLAGLGLISIFCSRGFYSAGKYRLTIASDDFTVPIPISKDDVLNFKQVVLILQREFQKSNV